MRFVGLILAVLFLTISDANSCTDQDGDQCNEIAYNEVAFDCYQIIRDIHRRSHQQHWLDSCVKEVLKARLEWYLIVVDTQESIQLLAQYESVGWNLPEMLKIHWNMRGLIEKL